MIHLLLHSMWIVSFIIVVSSNTYHHYTCLFSLIECPKSNLNLPTIEQCCDKSGKEMKLINYWNLYSNAELQCTINSSARNLHLLRSSKKKDTLNLTWIWTVLFMMYDKACCWGLFECHERNHWLGRKSIRALLAPLVRLSGLQLHRSLKFQVQNVRLKHKPLGCYRRWTVA